MKPYFFHRPRQPDQVAKIRKITAGTGVDAAFDFVGVSGIVKAAMESMAARGRYTIVGLHRQEHRALF